MEWTWRRRVGYKWGQNLPSAFAYSFAIGQLSSFPADDRLCQDSFSTSGDAIHSSLHRGWAALSKHLFLLASDLKASPSHHRTVASHPFGSAMEASSTSENGQPGEGAQSQPPTKSSKQRFKPQLSCTFCRNRKYVQVPVEPALRRSPMCYARLQ